MPFVYILRCADGNANQNDACKSDCTENFCGDGIVETGVEQCDDADALAGDGCDAGCQLERCFACVGEPSVCTPGTAACAPCQLTIVKEAAKFAQARSKALAKCEINKVKGALPPATDCALEPNTLAKLEKASDKLETKIGKQCGGVDDECNGGAGEDTPASLGWLATCPNFESSAEPACSAALTHCGDVTACLECTHETAVDQAMGLYFGNLLASAPGTALNKCQQMIGKEAQKFLARKVKELTKCWQKRAKGKHTDMCPNGAAPLGTAARKAADKIAKAEAKLVTKLCKACGGADKLCDGVNDFLPSAIGFPATCDAVTVPGDGRSCLADGSVDTLAELAGLRQFEGSNLSISHT